MTWFLLGCSDFGLHPREENQSNSPYIEVSPDHYSYGELPIQSSASSTFAIYNEGNAALIVDRISIPESDAFSLFFLQEQLSIAPGEVYRFDVVYVSSGSTEESYIRIESNDPVYPTLEVPIYGSAPAEGLVLSPDPLDFGYVPVEETAEDYVYIQNVGSSESEILGVSLGESAFSIPEVTVPFTLLPGESYALPVSFTPLTAARSEEPLWVESELGAHVVSIMGTAKEGDDPCLDDDLSYSEHPAAVLRVRDELEPVSVTYLGANAGFISEVWLHSPHLIYIATGYETPELSEVDLGTFTFGQELFFKIYVHDTGFEYYSGPAHRNPDNSVHAAITYLGDCEWMVGFEDLYKGGDDFNDIVIMVNGDLQMTL